MTKLSIRNLSLQIDGAPLLRDISISFEVGAFTAIVGANGAGKSMLMKCAIGLEQPSLGEVAIDGAPISNFSHTERARRLSYIPQNTEIAWPISTANTVALGQFAFGARFDHRTALARKAVQDAMQDCGVAHLADRTVDSLSGGEFARVTCARAFIAKADLLFADEPTAALDPKGRLEIARLFRQHVDSGAGVIAILHDINLAAAFADRLVWIADGAIFADGPPADTLTAENIAHAYGVKAQIMRHNNGITALFPNA